MTTPITITTGAQHGLTTGDYVSLDYVKESSFDKIFRKAVPNAIPELGLVRDTGFKRFFRAIKNYFLTEHTWKVVTISSSTFSLEKGTTTTFLDRLKRDIWDRFFKKEYTEKDLWREAVKDIPEMKGKGVDFDIINKAQNEVYNSIKQHLN